jgi:arabinogalactan oligomer/maltooligosaccharide transport system substrate-binding protein
MPNIPEMGLVWEPINNALNFIASGKQTPEQALNDAVKIIKDKIKTQKQ